MGSREGTAEGSRTFGVVVFGYRNCGVEECNRPHCQCTYSQHIYPHLHTFETICRNRRVGRERRAVERLEVYGRNRCRVYRGGMLYLVHPSIVHPYPTLHPYYIVHPYYGVGPVPGVDVAAKGHWGNRSARSLSPRKDPAAWEATRLSLGFWTSCPPIRWGMQTRGPAHSVSWPPAAPCVRVSPQRRACGFPRAGNGC